ASRVDVGGFRSPRRGRARFSLPYRNRSSDTVSLRVVPAAADVGGVASRVRPVPPVCLERGDLRGTGRRLQDRTGDGGWQLLEGNARGAGASWHPVVPRRI